MTRFTDYTSLADDGTVPLVWRHRLIDPDGGIAASTDADESPIHWGAELRPLIIDRAGVSKRLAQLSVPVTDLELVPDAQGILHPDSGYRVTLEAGVRLGGQAVYRKQATMLANLVTADDTTVANLVVDLVDTTRPVQSSLVTGFTFDPGELVTTVVARLLDQVLDNFNIAPSTYVVPSGSIESGHPRSRFVGLLLDGIGHELTTTADGLPITRPIPASADDPGVEFWRYGQSDGIPIERARRSWSVRTPQGWRVEAGSFQDPEDPITVTVYDTDPTSAGFFDGSADTQIKTLRAPFITSLTQAAESGYGQLRRSGVGPAVVEFFTIPNPGMEEGDLVELLRPRLNLNGRFRVLDYELPLQVDGLMRVVARQVYDPQLNFTLPNPTAGCQTSFTDAFDRGDENLENLPPGMPGSPDWIEHGWSWGVEGGIAIQRYPDGYSMALANEPLCDSNHHASTTIAQLPSGRRVGPVCRSTGQFDGYAFMADAGGQVALEIWVNGQRQTTLASGQFGSVAGQQMRVQAVGTQVSALIGGQTVLGPVSDDQCTGPYVGMLGFGGTPPNSPGVSLFTAGVAS